MKRRKQKTIPQVWIEYLDTLWRIIIHYRDGETCQWCKKVDGKMDAHHIFSRDDKSTRWDTRNGILLCYYCHQHKLHKRMEEFRCVAVMKLGIGIYQELYELSCCILHVIPFEEIELKLLKELEGLGIAIPKKKPRRLTSQTHPVLPPGS